ncbi:MAG: VanW family protein [Clostridia bacterium]
MKDHKRNIQRSARRDEDTYPEVYLEPIEDPGFDDIPDDEPLFNRKEKQRKSAIIVLFCCVIAVATIILVYFFVSNQKRQAAEIAAQIAQEEAIRLQQEQEKAEFEAMANSTVFVDGITVDGISIGGMNMEQARAALQPAVQSAHALGELQLTYRDKLYSIDLSPIATSNNLETVLADAYRLGKTGDYTAMKTESEDIKTNGRTFSLTASFDLSSLSTRVAEIAALVDTPAKDASVSSVDTEAHTIVFGNEVIGVTVQQDILMQTITNAILNKNFAPIAIPVLETNPIVTKDMLTGKYVKRASFTTNFADSTSDRKYNVRKGAGMINGTILKPDEVFSTNDALGTRTTANGWKTANAYESGAVVPQAGGGVCQLSTTLYNAVLKADLEIVFRRNHSMPVGYIEKGLDATINSVGNIIDFKFKNNTTSDLVIFGYTVDNKKLTFEIWGVPFATNEYDEIKLSSKQTAVYEPDGLPVEVLVIDGTIAPGESVVKVSARKGYQYQSYKNYYKDGKLVRSEPLALSTYKAFSGEIWIGPSPSPEPQYTPTQEPVYTPAPPSHTPDPGGIPSNPNPIITADPVITANAESFG